MEEILKSILTNLGKGSPWIIGGLLGAYFLTKTILEFLREQAEKKRKAIKEAEENREKTLKERDEKRDALFRETIENRENFFREELRKKDVIIEQYRQEVKTLNEKLGQLIAEDIDTRNNTNAIMGNLTELLKATLKGHA